MRRREPDEAAVAAAWQCASILLDYPASRSLEPIRALQPYLTPGHQASIRGFLDHVERVPVHQVQEEYVATFDSVRRHNLFLTYFAHGDTRKRGMALLRFKRLYQQYGVTLADDELPDHLCVVLEFASTVDLAAGRQLLLDHRAGLELLRMSLTEASSPWAPLLDVVCSPLPALRGDEREAVRRLAAEGPPSEEVGLAPYVAAAGPVELPMPRLRHTVSLSAQGGSDE